MIVGTTYVWHRGIGKVVPKEDAPPDPRERKAPVNLMGDIEPFVSPVDGKPVMSRAARREHNRRHGVVDIGNDQGVFKRKTPYEPRGVGEDIKRAFEEHGHG